MAAIAASVAFSEAVLDEKYLSAIGTILALGRAVADHLGWRQTKGQSESTVTGARQLLGYFVAWCEERGITKPVEVMRETIERYQKWLRCVPAAEERQAADVYGQSQRADALELFQWLTRANRILVNPARTSSCPS